MAFLSRKPILVGGLGISIFLGLWEVISHSILPFNDLSLLLIIALGGSLWFIQKNNHHPDSLSIISPVTEKILNEAMVNAQTMINHLATETPLNDYSALKQELNHLSELSHRQNLQLAITGGRKVGKTTLKKLLETLDFTQDITWLETEPLFTDFDNLVQQQLFNADLVLFLTDGDLTDSQWQFLQQLQLKRQRFLLILNKQDRYRAEEKAIILQQLKSRLDKVITTEDIIPIAASPVSVKVRQHQINGSVEEWLESQTPSLNNLCDRIKYILNNQQQELILATTWRGVISVKNKSQNILNNQRRQKALPIIEKYQWLTATAAFANPVSAIDLLATVAINGQMIVDLSQIYQQKLSLSQAQNSAIVIGKLIVKLGLVEFSTQTIASILKTNAITYLAGGTIQGLSAAYLTRLAGLSLIEYLQDQEINSNANDKLNIERLTEKVKQIFEQNQKAAFLNNFVKQAVTHLSPASSNNF